MSNNNNEDLISSLYPPPPPYVKFFTQERLNKLETWKQEESKRQQQSIEIGNTEGKIEDEDVPPGELKFLIPPKPPAGAHYRGYGNLWSFEDRLPSLKDSGWKQLYKDNDETITSNTKIEELHKLMDSLLLNFLELIGTVSIDPSQFHLKIEDLKLILININHILNTYRPHQSRESLIMLLKKQIDSKRVEINEIDRVSQEIKSKIINLISVNKISNAVSGKLETTTATVTENESIKDEIVNKLLEEYL